jgi:hypothetical protein
LIEIEKLLILHEDEYQDKRKALKDKIYIFNDGKSIERIVEFVEYL